MIDSNAEDPVVRKKGYFITNDLHNALRVMVEVTFPLISIVFFVITVITDDSAFLIVGGAFIGMTLLIGLFLSITQMRTDGDIVIIDNDEGGRLYSLELRRSAGRIDEKDTVVFKVKKSDEAQL